MKLFSLMIIILIVFILGIIIIKKVKIPFISSGYQKKFFFLYCFLLIVSAVTLNLIPQKNFIKTETTNEGLVTKSNRDNISNLISKGNFQDSKIFVQKDNWSFNYSDKKLKIINSNNMKVVVDRKNVDDGKIEVLNYMINTTYQGINITNMTSPSKVQLTKDELVLVEDENYKVNIAQFNLDFTTSQFLKNASTQNNQSSLGFFIDTIMYIKIPKSLEGIESNDIIEMIKH
ncbi:MAG: hypothetical protein H7Y18_03315 [Clostridiaceae bacterium]|nr:hypothetical protein [Clostridiaceae bacterium]